MDGQDRHRDGKLDHSYLYVTSVRRVSRHPVNHILKRKLCDQSVKIQHPKPTHVPLMSDNESDTPLVPEPLSQYELQRLETIKENKRKLDMIEKEPGSNNTKYKQNT